MFTQQQLNVNRIIVLIYNKHTFLLKNINMYYKFGLCSDVIIDYLPYIKLLLIFCVSLYYFIWNF